MRRLTTVAKGKISFRLKATSLMYGCKSGIIKNVYRNCLDLNVLPRLKAKTFSSIKEDGQAPALENLHFITINSI